MKNPPIVFTGTGTWHLTKPIRIARATFIPTASDGEAKITDGTDNLFLHLKTVSGVALNAADFSKEPLELVGMKISALTTGTLYIYPAD